MSTTVIGANQFALEQDPLNSTKINFKKFPKINFENIGGGDVKMTLEFVIVPRLIGAQTIPINVPYCSVFTFGSHDDLTQGEIYLDTTLSGELAILNIRTSGLVVPSEKGNYSGKPTLLMQYQALLTQYHELLSMHLSEVENK